MLMALNQLTLRYRLVIETFTFCSSASAQSAAVEANKSNSPFNVAPSFTNQNYFTLSVFSVNSPTNDFLPHPTVPIELNSLTGVPPIFRATTPISARPDPSGGYNTGLGEINLFDISFSSQSDIQVGVEPLLTMPTATDPSGNWLLRTGNASTSTRSNFGAKSVNGSAHEDSYVVVR